MSKCVYKEIADRLNREEVITYYQHHLPREVAAHFGFDQIYFYRIFDYLGIPRRSAAENTRVQFANMSDEARLERGRKISASEMGHPTSPSTRQKLSECFQGCVIQYKSEESLQRALSSRFQPGQTPWNKGQTGCYVQSPETIQKRNESKRRNKTFSTSTWENEIYSMLCIQYGSENVIRQYRDSRYPFACDFYVISEDLFIKCNFHWTHGGMPFNSEDPSCIAQLTLWQEKSKSSRFYQQAIQTWTVRDVKKIQAAIEHHLNYIMYYTY